MHRVSKRFLLGLLGGASLWIGGGPCQAAASEFPSAFDAAGHEVILVAHGEGAQIYECKPDSGGHAVWVFREPIATLLQDGKTVGRHYAGPNWDLLDGSGVKGKLSSSAPAASAQDIPLLKLDAIDHRGSGSISQATMILRLNTHGGLLNGACEQIGGFRPVPYSADYVFLR